MTLIRGGWQHYVLTLMCHLDVRLSALMGDTRLNDKLEVSKRMSYFSLCRMRVLSVKQVKTSRQPLVIGVPQ
jgi:hypothetical protein